MLAKAKTISCPVVVECHCDDGTTTFYSHEKIWSDPALQKRVVDKRVLREVMQVRKALRQESEEVDRQAMLRQTHRSAID